MDICAANNQFTIDIFREISTQDVGQNVLFSSMSILTALAMVRLGAKGNTASQMDKVLHFSDVANVPSKCKALNNELVQNDHDYTLININKLFGEKTFQFLPSFLKTFETSYGPALEEVDFYNDPEGTRQYINEWIKKESKEKIQGLLPENSISSKTALVLANTLYFFSNWTKQFKERDTRKTPFKLESGKDVLVDMMFRSDWVNMNYEKGISILELTYGVSGNLSMFMLLPDNNTVLKWLDEHISYEDLTKWTSREKMKSVNAAIYIPRMKLVQTLKMGDLLSSMGMSDAFSPIKANFSGMTDRDDLYVSELHHKTFLEVNEKGTEAASATAAVMSYRSLPVETFKVDRPFHFFIRHKKTKCILIYGKVCQP
ncbi:leukocyte elastase inhibitor-like [Pelodytes ibericus]